MACMKRAAITEVKALSSPRISSERGDRERRRRPDQYIVALGEACTYIVVSAETICA